MLNAPQEPLDRRPTGARGWLARFAFSFLILGGVAGYEGWRAQVRGESNRATILFIGAAAGLSLGMMGLRLRHRP